MFINERTKGIIVDKYRLLVLLTCYFDNKYTIPKDIPNIIAVTVKVNIFFFIMLDAERPIFCHLTSSGSGARDIFG